jgi:hypothetical protein
MVAKTIVYLFRKFLSDHNKRITNCFKLKTKSKNPETNVSWFPSETAETTSFLRASSTKWDNVSISIPSHTTKLLP